MIKLINLAGGNDYLFIGGKKVGGKIVDSMYTDDSNEINIINNILEIKSSPLAIIGLVCGRFASKIVLVFDNLNILLISSNYQRLF